MDSGLILVGGFVAIFFLMAWGAFTYLDVWNYVERRHPDWWDRLGSPSKFDSPTTRRDTRVMWRFVVNREFLEVEDEELSRLCNRVLVFRRWGFPTIFGLLLVILATHAMVSSR